MFAELKPGVLSFGQPPARTSIMFFFFFLFEQHIFSLKKHLVCVEFRFFGFTTRRRWYGFDVYAFEVAYETFPVYLFLPHSNSRRCDGQARTQTFTSLFVEKNVPRGVLRSTIIRATAFFCLARQIFPSDGSSSTEYCVRRTYSSQYGMPSCCTRVFVPDVDRS